jgi:hypothetical protein
MLQFGFNWPNELAAQKAIVDHFGRHLEKGYTLIRNMTLGASGITVPIILLGPTGIYVIQVTHLRGRYEARADSWNEASGNGYKPAAVNLLKRTSRMAEAVKAFIERQGVKLPVPIEPVLIAADPGLHIESVRPMIKVMMSDAIRSFVSGLAASRPILGAEVVSELAERIVDPRPPKKAAPAAPPAAVPSASEEPTVPPLQSRAREIFNASEEAKPFDPADFDFAMLDEEPAAQTPPASIHESSPARPLPRPAPVQNKSRKILGMTMPQVLLIAGLALAFLCVLVVLVGLYLASGFPL